VCRLGAPHAAFACGDFELFTVEQGEPGQTGRFPRGLEELASGPSSLGVNEWRASHGKRQDFL
jgi:hypothetical protein